MIDKGLRLFIKGMLNLIKRQSKVKMAKWYKQAISREKLQMINKHVGYLSEANEVYLPLTNSPQLKRLITCNVNKKVWK